MKRILCFGDSNTWGYIPEGNGARYDENTRWTQLMQKALGSDFAVIEEGHNGRTTVFFDPFEYRMAGIDYFYPCIVSQSPLDLIILMLGSNDLKARFSVTAPDIADGFDRYHAALKTANLHGSDPKVLLVAPAEMDPAYHHHPSFSTVFGPDADKRSKGFAEAYRKTAEKHGWSFLDAALYAKASPLDGLHLDAEAHRSLAGAITAKVRKLLK